MCPHNGMTFVHCQAYVTLRGVILLPKSQHPSFFVFHIIKHQQRSNKELNPGCPHVFSLRFFLGFYFPAKLLVSPTPTTMSKGCRQV